MVNLVVNGVTYEYPEVNDTEWGADATAWAQAITVGLLQKSGGVFQLLAEVDFGTSYGLKSLYLKSRGTNVAGTGVIRLANNEEINWRDAANTEDLVLKVNASDVLEFDGAGISVGGDPVQTEITVSDTSTIDLTLAASNLSASIVADSITNAMINAAAAIAYSKLSLTGSIINADVSASAAIAYSKLSLAGSIVNADLSASAAIANAKLADMATLTIKGNSTGGSAAPSDLSVATVTSMLNAFVGDSGSGGTKGMVPAPASGDAAANKFLKANGSWEAPSGSGDVVGPASSTDSGFARFDGTDGKLLKNSAATISYADLAVALQELLVPTGSVLPFAGSSAPAGWLLCFGQAVSRDTYSGLFAVVSTTYGSGDGSTTFNVPDLRGRVAVGKDNMGGSAANRMTSGGSGVDGSTLGASGGAQTVTLTSSEMPSHTHTQDAHTHFVAKTETGTNIANNANSIATVRDNGDQDDYAMRRTAAVGPTADVGLSSSATATNQNTGGDGAHNNTQPALILNYAIKT